MNLVADLVRWKKATEALSMLEFLPKKGARTLYKLVKSAVANAKHNNGLDETKLILIPIFMSTKPKNSRLTGFLRTEENKP